MVSGADETLRSDDVNRTTEIAAVSRRRALQAGIVAAVSLSGCLDDVASSDPDDGNDDEADGSSDDESEERATDDEAGAEEDGDAEAADDPSSVVDAFLEAAVEEGLDRMSELSHSRNPLDPAAWVEDGWEFRGGGDEQDLEELDVEVIDNDASVTDVFELDGAEFWFEEDELAETLDDADMAMVEVTAEDPAEDDTVWMLATEGGEWRYLFAAPIDDTPDDPEEVFEEPIEDEDDDVVVEIDWAYDSPTSDVPQAAVEITEERGIDANRIEIESTIEGASTGAYDRDDDEFTATWDGGSTLYIPYDTDGDQIVVTAINEAENESTVVHREHYEP